MRFWTYFYSSLLFVMGVVTYAVYTREQFYPTMLYLVRSKVSMVAGGNLVLALTLLFGRISKSIFFGALRDAEVELLLERAKYTITETCLALTIFRSELNPSILAMFGLLLFLKSFHWLSSSRLDHLEQITPVSIATHVRLSILILLLMTCDISVAYYCVQQTIAHGKSVLILFGFECGVLVISVFNITCRFIIHIIDVNTRHGLVSKGLYIMIIDLICDAFRFVTYVFFFCLVFVYYGLPIHIIREVGIAFYNFQRRLVSLIKYLRLTKNLDERFENATQEEMTAAGDCLICREGLETGKKLACGHVFHLDCLRMWLQHQQTCPLCRADIPMNATINNRPQQEANVVIPVAPNIPNVNNENNENTPREDASQVDTDRLTPLLSPDEVENFPAFCRTCVHPHLKIYERTDVTSKILRVIKPGITLWIQCKETVNGTNWLQINDGWLLELQESRQPAILHMHTERYFRNSVKTNSPHQHLSSYADLLPQSLSSSTPSTKPDFSSSPRITPFSSRSKSMDKLRAAPFSSPIDNFEMYSDHWDDESPNINFKSTPGFSATPNSTYSNDSSRDKLLLMQMQLRDLTDGLRRMQGFAQSCEKALSNLIDEEINKSIDEENIKDNIITSTTERMEKIEESIEKIGFIEKPVESTILRDEEKAAEFDLKQSAIVIESTSNVERDSTVFSNEKGATISRNEKDATISNNERDTTISSNDKIVQKEKESPIRDLRAQYFTAKYNSQSPRNDDDDTKK